MASQLGSGEGIRIMEARLSDLDSLSTILPRSFFPVNETVKKALPDAPVMREWWKTVYREEIESTSCHPLIALDTATDAVVGVVCMRLHSPDDRYGGFWTKHPWTDDHGSKIWGPPIDCMVEYEKRIMESRTHYLLELLAVDHAYKSLGIGKKLTTKACEMADQSGNPIFLQSGGAKDFYLKLGTGFYIEDEPTWAGYKACLIVRLPRVDGRNSR